MFCSFQYIRQRQSKDREGGDRRRYLGGPVDSRIPSGCTCLEYSVFASFYPSSLGGGNDIQCVLQDCSSPESSGCPEPKRRGGSEAACGSQEKLDFNRNLKEGKVQNG